ncbi:MAG: hypothetical protein EHM20_08285 [Alphaproteobacteria bacterium]|nr:MAG: hypothetical protein EHM20_08285 [Alphaproteobacteria bacterium]
MEHFLVVWKKGYKKPEERVQGNFLSEALVNAGHEITDLGMMDYFVKLPQPVEIEEKKLPRYQLFIREKKTSKFVPVGKASENFASLDFMLQFEIKKCGKFFGIIFDLSTEKAVACLYN